jgi:DNA-directed RNA polymerase specialized sigma24 family protein
MIRAEPQLVTAPEATDHLKIFIDVVKSRLHRARQMMREHLLASGYLAVEPG